MSDMIQIGGLWENKDKKDNVYLSGYLGNAKIIIFKNGFKKEQKHPDWIMYIAEGKKREAPAGDKEKDKDWSSEESPL